MDVIVTPVSGPRQEWHLTDRLGRKVGRITQFGEDQFLISAEDNSPHAPLATMDASYKSLNAALDAIALHMRGACRFSNEEDG